MLPSLARTNKIVVTLVIGSFVFSFGLLMGSQSGTGIRARAKKITQLSFQSAFDTESDLEHESFKQYQYNNGNEGQGYDYEPKQDEGNIASTFDRYSSVANAHLSKRKKLQILRTHSNNQHVRSVDISAVVNGSQVNIDKEQSLVYSRLMKDRITNLKLGCSNHSTIWTRKTARQLMHTSTVNAVYCATAKVGSSFLERVFYVLDKGAEDKSPLEMSSTAIHGQVSKLRLTEQESLFQGADDLNTRLKNTTKFMFTRDPYGKVFSAYCDKIFLRAMPQVNNKIMEWKYRQNNRTVQRQTFDHLASLNVSFSEALQYAAGETGKRSIDHHFLSPSHGCDVCHVNYDFIGKMESFNGDVNYILSYLNKSSVFDSMGDVDTNNERGIITDIVNRTFRSFRVSNRKRKKMIAPVDYNKCLLREITLRRLWKLWKIRGFIYDNKTFPWNSPAVICDLNQEEYQLASTAALEDSEDRASRKAQRHKYLVQAFKSVPLAVLKRYRKAVQIDCDLFGYDCSPDYIFGGRDDGDEESNVFSNIKYTYMN